MPEDIEKENDNIEDDGLEEVLEIGKPAPNFSCTAFHNEEFKQVSLSDYKGKWVVLFFYPADFTFVCPTELNALATNYETLKALNVEVLSVSTDTHFSHKAWHDTSDTVKKVQFPMLADPTHEISRAYNVLIEEQGITHRGTFIINPSGELVAKEVHHDNIGRSIHELIRKVKAAQFAESHPGEACPVDWEEGAKSIEKGIHMVGKI